MRKSIVIGHDVYSEDFKKRLIENWEKRGWVQIDRYGRPCSKYTLHFERVKKQ